MGRTTTNSKETAALVRIGERIRGLREAKGLSLSAAAERGGVSVVRWRALENGVGNPTVATLVRVALALDTTFAGLVSEPGSHGPT